MNTPPKKPTPNTIIARHIQKPAWQNTTPRRPVAPPVYRPQAVPRVLQTKRPPGQQLHQAPRQLVGPPVYRPEVKKIVQPKASSPLRNLPTAPVYRPQQTRVAQPKTTAVSQLATMPSTASPLRRPPIMISPRGRTNSPVLQRKVGFEFELGGIKTQKHTSFWRRLGDSWQGHSRGEVILHRPGYDVTADVSEDGESQIEFVLHEIDENTSAGKNAIVNAATNVVADIRKLCQVRGQWIAGEQIWGDSSRGHRFQAHWPFNKQAGQLQMTGGINIERIGHIVSGQAGDLTERYGLHAAAEFLGNYKSGNDQPVWRNALAAVKRNFSGMWPARQEVLAGVVAMIAQVPLSMHNQAENMLGQGMFTAKTDYSKILVETVHYIGQDLPPNPFVQTVLDTINGTIAGGLNPGKRLAESDGVFPDDYTANKVRLGGVLKIGPWLREMLPGPTPQGIDRLTPHGFPGDESQRREMRAFGRFGSKTDPGNRPIVEWRNISTCYPDDLPNVVRDMVDYLRLANKVKTD